MKRSVRLRLQDALDAMDTAEAFIEAMSLEEFLGDLKTQYAVERCLVIVGEALRHVPEVVRSDYPEVPWRDIGGMRNRLSHDYLRTDPEIVWRTVHDDFPAVRPLLEGARDAQPDDPAGR